MDAAENDDIDDDIAIADPGQEFKERMRTIEAAYEEEDQGTSVSNSSDSSAAFFTESQQQ